MDIKVLGSGCVKCDALVKKTSEVIEELGIDARISKEEDITKIMEYGILRTPGLVIDEKVVFSGRIPSRKELRNLLTV